MQVAISRVRFLFCVICIVPVLLIAHILYSHILWFGVTRTVLAFSFMLLLILRISYTSYYSCSVILITFNSVIYIAIFVCTFVSTSSCVCQFKSTKCFFFVLRFLLHALYGARTPVKPFLGFLSMPLSILGCLHKVIVI